MLIALCREYGKGHVAHGWCGDLYWRAIAVDRGIISTGIRCNRVYIQVLVPAQPLRLNPDWDMTFKSQYNGHVEYGVTVYVPGYDDDALPENMAIQWVEFSYGTQRIATASGRFMDADLRTVWYPRKRGGLEVPVMPSTFLKCIQPAAEYVCTQLQNRIAEIAAAEEGVYCAD